MCSKNLIKTVVCIVTITVCVIINTYFIIQVRDTNNIINMSEENSTSHNSYVDTDGDYNTYDVTIEGTEQHLIVDSETMENIMTMPEDIYVPEYDGELTTIVDGIYNMADVDIILKINELYRDGKLYLNTKDLTGSDTDDLFTLENDGYLYESNSIYKWFRFSLVNNEYPDDVFVEDVFVFKDDTVYCTMSRG